MRNILLTCAGGFSGLSLIRALSRDPSVRLIVVDSTDLPISSFLSVSTMYAPPIAENDRYLEFLLQTCAAHQVETILPCLPYDLRLLSSARQRFSSANVQVAVCDLPLLEVLLDKWKTAEFLKSAGLPILPTWESPPENVAFPIIAKPRSSFGSKGIAVARNAAELAALSATRATSTDIWQPYLEAFREISVDIAIRLDGGDYVCAARERLATSLGFATVCRAITDSEITTLAEKLSSSLAASGARGLLNAQLLINDDGVSISDINPRVGTSSIHSYLTGVNQPLFVCASATAGGALPPPPFARRAIMARMLSEQWVVPAPSVSGLVFDLDDTLIDQKAWIASRLELTWEALRGELPPQHEFMTIAVRALEEGNRRYLIDALAEDLRLDAQARTRLLDSYRSTVPARPAIFPEVIEQLTRLKRRGLRLALLTDEPGERQQGKLADGRLLSLFDASVFTPAGERRKPDGSGFVRAAEAIGLKPAGLASVGDNPYRDVLGAIQAGYATAFLVRRRGIALNPSPDLLARYVPAGSYIEVETLHDVELSLYPPEAVAGNDSISRTLR